MVCKSAADRKKEKTVKDEALKDPGAALCR
jgi:hypothetical protein